LPASSILLVGKKAEKYGDLTNCIFDGKYACVGLITVKKDIQGNFILYGEELRCREAKTRITKMQHSTYKIKIW
jgi:hypothetical protein